MIFWDEEEAASFVKHSLKQDKETKYIDRLAIEKVSVQDPANYISRLATEAGLNPDDNVDFISPIANAVRCMQQINLLPFIELARKYLNNEHSISYRLPLLDPGYVVHTSPLEFLLERIKKERK